VTGPAGTSDSATLPQCIRPDLAARRLNTQAYKVGHKTHLVVSLCLQRRRGDTTSLHCAEQCGLSALQQIQAAMRSTGRRNKTLLPHPVTPHVAEHKTNG